MVMTTSHDATPSTKKNRHVGKVIGLALVVGAGLAAKKFLTRQRRTDASKKKPS
jgi:hypothetical protein